MSRSSKILIVAACLALALAPAASLLAAEKEAPAKKPGQKAATAVPMMTLMAKPAPDKAAAAAAEKIKELRSHLGRALSIACDLFSGNEAELFSNNRAALLSGNSPELLSGNSPKLLSGNSPKLLSGNKPEILSGNKPTILSGNQTPILSGNSFSMLNNLKIEIHIENSGNQPGARHGAIGMPGARAYPVTPPTTRSYPVPSNATPNPTYVPSPATGR